MGEGSPQKNLVIARNAFRRAPIKTGSVVLNLQLQFRFPPHHNQPQLETSTDHLQAFQPEPNPAEYLFSAEIALRERKWEARANTLRGLAPGKTLLPISRLCNRLPNSINQFAKRDLRH